MYLYYNTCKSVTGVCSPLCTRPLRAKSRSAAAIRARDSYIRDHLRMNRTDYLRNPQTRGWGDPYVPRAGPPQKSDRGRACLSPSVGLGLCRCLCRRRRPSRGLGWSGACLKIDIYLRINSGDLLKESTAGLLWSDVCLGSAVPSE